MSGIIGDIGSKSGSIQNMSLINKTCRATPTSNNSSFDDLDVTGWTERINQAPSNFSLESDGWRLKTAGWYRLDYDIYMYNPSGAKYVQWYVGYQTGGSGGFTTIEETYQIYDWPTSSGRSYLRGAKSMVIYLGGVTNRSYTLSIRNEGTTTSGFWANSAGNTSLSFTFLNAEKGTHAA